ncbi:MAG TPA: TIGR03435 family protein [Candidatus Acidoferrales bacterium]|nr:TIGR03435 family protein [Candidatus Acidoferrales bacterium]
MPRISAAMLSAVLLAAFAAPDQHQQTKSSVTARLEFEVASIKPSDPNEPGNGIRADPGGETMHAENATVRLMIRSMWKLNDVQIVGAPDWVNKDLWTVRAKADGPHNLDDLHTMYQNMVIDRFNMQFHWDTRDLPMFALVAEKSGPKITVSADPGPCRVLPLPVLGGKFQARHCDLQYFTWIVSQFPWIARPVVDETGLDKANVYDFNLAFEPEVSDTVDRSTLPPAPGPNFFTAVREQLGLRLESRKGPVPAMVIDHIEKPGASDN